MKKVSLEVKELFALAIREYKNKNLLTAENYYRKILEILPKDLPTLNNLGNILGEQKKYKEAIFYFEKALDNNPQDIITNYNFGLLFNKLEEFDKSENFYNKVIEIDPKHTLSYHNLMDIYEKTNNQEKLKKIIVKAKSSINNNLIVKLYEGVYLHKNEQFKEAISILESFFFEKSNIKQEQLRVLTLGKCYDRNKTYDKAFNYFTKTNQISFKLKSKDIDKNLYLNEIKNRQKFFSKIKKENWSYNNLSNENINPTFMIGFPRSGTTLLDTILRGHPLIEVIEEKPTVNNLINSLNEITKNKFENLKEISVEEIKKIRKSYSLYLESYIKEKNKSKIYIDKLPLNIIYVGEILRIFPDAKFILSLRHPCDCVFSCFMQTFRINNAMANFFNLDDSAKLYDAVMNLWNSYISAFRINYCEVKYENLIENIEFTTKKVLEFLELPWNDSLLEFHKTAKKRKQIKTPSYDQVIKPIYSEANGRWKMYKKQMSNVYPILEPWIKKYKY